MKGGANQGGKGGNYEPQKKLTGKTKESGLAFKKLAAGQKHRENRSEKQPEKGEQADQAWKRGRHLRRGL